MKTTVVISDGKTVNKAAPLEGSLEETFRKAAGIGFDSVVLTVADPAEFSAEELKELCIRYGVGISALATGRIYSVMGYSLGMSDEAGREKAVAYMKANTDLADQLRDCNPEGEAPLVIIGAVRGRFKDAASEEEFMDHLHKSVEEIVHYAEAKQVGVIIEAIETLESEAYRGIAETADYIRSFHSPYFGLQIDTMHMRREGQTLADVAAAADVLKQVDISGDDRKCPTQDDYDYEGLMQVLKQISYTEWVNFEHMSYEPEDAAAVGYAYITAMM